MRIGLPSAPPDHRPPKKGECSPGAGLCRLRRWSPTRSSGGGGGGIRAPRGPGRPERILVAAAGRAGAAGRQPTAPRRPQRPAASARLRARQSRRVACARSRPRGRPKEIRCAASCRRCRHHASSRLGVRRRRPNASELDRVSETSSPTPRAASNARPLPSPPFDSEWMSMRQPVSCAVPAHAGPSADGHDSLSSGRSAPAFAAGIDDTRATSGARNRVQTKRAESPCRDYSIFSPRSSCTTACTREPFMPTQAPTGSTSRSRELTAIFERAPASRAEAAMRTIFS